MFGKRACDLLREVAHVSADAIPPYNDESVRLVLEELQQHNAAMLNIIRSVEEREAERREAEGGPSAADGEDDAAPDWGRYPADASAIIVHHDSILRNKRQLWTYMSRRYQLIRDLRWQGRFLPDHVRQNLSPQELQFFDSYNRLLTTGLRGYSGYMSRSEQGVATDLTLDSIPRGVTVAVRVLKDEGEVAFSVGRVNLRQGSIHTLPPDEVQPFIREGVLERLDVA